MAEATDVKKAQSYLQAAREAVMQGDADFWLDHWPRVETPLIEPTLKAISLGQFPQTVLQEAREVVRLAEWLNEQYFVPRDQDPLPFVTDAARRVA